jgi:hypothetical protein
MPETGVSGGKGAIFPAPGTLLFWLLNAGWRIRWLFNTPFLERLLNRLVHLLANLIDAKTRGTLARRIINESLQESRGF